MEHCFPLVSEVSEVSDISLSSTVHLSSAEIDRGERECMEIMADH
jgi:hypothetical protein